jgi:hypothetical protein
MSLRATLNDLAASFANHVLAAIRAASLQDLHAEGGAGSGRRGRPRGAAKASRPARSSSGRLARRSPAEIAAVIDKVRGLLRGKKSGLRSEEIQAALKLDRRELPRVLLTGLKSKKLRKVGQKRATHYFAR